MSKAASEGQRWSVKHGYTAFPKLTALLPDRKSVVASARTMALFPPQGFVANTGADRALRATDP